MNTTQSDLDQLAAQVAQKLQELRLKLVCAESCTAGLIAATLARIPGASQWMCGSAVVYRLETKAVWLNVDRDKLQDPGPVSSIIADQMAVGVLEKTAEADVSLSITGDLGPGAPTETDGIAWVGIAAQSDEKQPRTVLTRKLELQQETIESEGSLRHHRHQEAVYRALGLLLEHL
ncbi:MAG: CinA family protein, partial [Planctomycetaceae bacterium]|nr:CinA family protein [Planctomycetaceae bacterium]